MEWIFCKKGLSGDELRYYRKTRWDGEQGTTDGKQTSGRGQHNSETSYAGATQVAVQVLLS